METNVKKTLVSYLVISIFFVTSCFAACDAQTILMLHCNGIDASTSFPDDSISAKTVTAVSDAQVDTAQKKFGTGSGQFQTTSDSLSIPDSADWDFGTGDFTVDFWIRYVSTASHYVYSRNNDTEMALYYNGSTYALWVGTSQGSWSFTPTLDQWYHLAFVRSSGSMQLYIDGTGQTAFANSSNISGTNALYIGDRALGDVGLNGWIDEYRVSNTARFTSNFTPSISEYCAATNLGMIAVFE